MACALASAVLLGSPRVRAGDDELSRAEDAAKAAAETPDGKTFGETVGQAFGREHGGTIQDCAKKTKRPDLSDFALLVKVDEAGLVERALVKPPTNLAECVRSAMAGWKTGRPPQPGTWVKIAVTLKKR
jgi:hypothetical protein